MLKEFTCVSCGSIDMLRGGTNGHLCNPCKVVAGKYLGRTPQQQAHTKVANAIRQGVLKRPNQYACVDCSKPAIEYDHRDYSKPLEVEPVCRRCNLLRGSAVGHDTGLRRRPIRTTA